MDMLKISKKWLSLFLFLAGCSSTNRYDYYKVNPIDTEAPPAVSQKPELVYLTYKTLYRSAFQNDYQQRAWIRISNYSRHTYTFGPIFLPVIPYYDGSSGLDTSKKITIELSAYSDSKFPERIMSVPDLVIETSDGRVLRPILVTEGGPGTDSKKFEFDATVALTPWFFVQAAEIQLKDAKTLKIPRMKFTLTSEFIINWNDPVAP